MGIPSNFLKFSASILLTVLLITLSFFVGRQSMDLAAVSSENVNSKREEIENADLDLLQSKVLSGTEVCTAIRKYMREVDVAVRTSKLGSAEAAPVYNSVNPFTNTDVESVHYVYADAKFDCAVSYDLNGALSTITFTQQGEYNLADEPTSAGKTAEQALSETRVMLADIFELEDDASWSSVLRAAKNSYAGISTLNENLQKQLAEKDTLLRSYEEAANNYVVKTSSGTLNAKRVSGSATTFYDVTFQFKPSSILVTIDGVNYIMVDNVWYLDGVAYNQSVFTYDTSTYKLTNKSASPLEYKAFE